MILVPAILLLVACVVRLIGQEKKAPAGLSGAGPVVQGTADDPLRDPREVHLRHVKQLTSGGTNAEAHFSFDGKAISSAVAGMLPNADIKVSGPSLLLKDVAVGRKSLLPAIVTKRIKVDAGMRDIILMKRLAGML